MLYNCRTCKIAKLNKVCSLTLYPCVAITCITVTSLQMIDVAHGSAHHSLWLVLTAECFYGCFLTVGLFMLWFAAQCYRFENRKYAASEKGISFTNGFNGVRMIPWSEVKEISMCAFESTASLEAYHTVYCIFLKPIPQEFGKRLLHSYVYAIKNLNWLIVIDFNEENRHCLEAHYDRRIPDRRNIQLRGYREQE